MATKIFVNLSVRDLKRSIEFFTSLGYNFNQQFTDDKGACMVISDDIFVMLLVEPFFKTFIPNQIADTTQTTESIICLSADSRENVDEMVQKAVSGGATIYKEAQDQGFMYGHGYRDLDGHLWEIMWMDTSSVKKDQELQPQQSAV